MLSKSSFSSQMSLLIAVRNCGGGHLIITGTEATAAAATYKWSRQWHGHELSDVCVKPECSVVVLG